MTERRSVLFGLPVCFYAGWPSVYGDPDRMTKIDPSVSTTCLPLDINRCVGGTGSHQLAQFRRKTWVGCFGALASAWYPARYRGRSGCGVPAVSVRLVVMEPSRGRMESVESEHPCGARWLAKMMSSVGCAVHNTRELLKRRGL